MGIAVGLLLVATGAILAFAVEKDVSGLDIQVVGVILLIVGVVGIVLDFLFWEPWGPRYHRRTYVASDPGYSPPAPRRGVRYVEEEETGPPGPPLPPP
jgi:hypothetical protein